MSSEIKLLEAPFLPTKIGKCSFQLVFWSPPQVNVVKLNLDGSSRSASHHSGGGFLLRDCTGHVLFAASIYFGEGTSFGAKNIVRKVEDNHGTSTKGIL